MILENKDGLLLMRNDRLGERHWRSDNCYKLIYSSYGSGEYQTAQEDVSIDREEFFVFNPQTPHRQISAVKEKFLLELQPSLLKESAAQLNLSVEEPEFAWIAYKHPQIKQWVQFVRQFVGLHEEPESPINQLFLDNSLTQLSILLLQYGTGSHLHEFPELSAQTNLSRTMDAVKQSYQQDWTLAEMAAAAHMNKYQFSHAFKKEVGLSPYSWLQLYRLYRSQAALLNTGDTILSIALANGFKNVGSYNQLFRKVYRKSPQEFRGLHRLYP